MPHRPDGVLCLPAGLVDTGHEDTDHRSRDHHDAERDRQQDRVDHAHHHQRRDECQPPGAEAHQGVGGDLAQQGRVRGDPGHQVAGFTAVHGRDAKSQQIRRQGAPRAEDDRLRGALQDVPTERADPRVGDDQSRHQQQGPGDRTVVGERVDEELGHQRQREPCGSGDQRQHRPEEQRPAVRTYVAQEHAPGGRGGSGRLIVREPVQRCGLGGWGGLCAGGHACSSLSCCAGWGAGVRPGGRRHQCTSEPGRYGPWCEPPGSQTRREALRLRRAAVSALHVPAAPGDATGRPRAP